MKIFLTGDVHFDCRNGNQKLLESNVLFWRWAVKEAKKQGVVQYYILGDIFDNRSLVNLPSLSKGYTILSYLKDETHLIVGNHDSFYRNSLAITSLDIFEDVDGMTVHKKPLFVLDHFGVDKHALFIPWICESNYQESIDLIKSVKNKKNTIVFTHAEFHGALLPSNMVIESNTNPSLFKGFKRVFAAHIHKQQTIKNILYVGSPYEQRSDEAKDKHGFWIYDTVADELEFFENKVSYRHITLTPEQVLKSKDLENNFIKMKVDNCTNDEVIAAAKAKLNEKSVGSITIDYEQKEVLKLDEDIDIENINTTKELFKEYIDLIDVENIVDKKQLLDSL